MELPALLICPIFYLVNTTNLFTLNSVFILLWITHYFNRTVLYPLKIKTKGKKMPLVIACQQYFLILLMVLLMDIFFL